MGFSFYTEFKGYARHCVPIATLILFIALLLSNIFYWEFLSSILDIITGTSLIFIAYIFGVVLLLDNEYDAEVEYQYNNRFVVDESDSIQYHASRFRGVVLIILAISAVYFSNRYRKHYAFECETFLVEETKGVYHIPEFDDGHINYTIEMKGYEIEESGYSLCETCSDWAEEASLNYSAESYHR